MYNEAELKERVHHILFGNMIKGYSKLLDFEYCYTKPAKARYPFQYFWDTCFHSIMLVALDEIEHAKWHVRSLLAAQRDDGFIGNIVYWKQIMPARLADFFQIKFSSIAHFQSPHMSEIIQPPLVAHAVLRIYEATNDKAFVTEVLPKLKLYFDWLANNRDFDGDGLISIITSFESGMDWKPTFDAVVNFSEGQGNRTLFRKMVKNDFKNFIRNYNLEKIAKAGYFKVKDAGFNSIYARNLMELGELCKVAEDPDSAKYIQQAKKGMNSIVELMYDEEDAAFYDVSGHDNRKIKILTPTIFYPVIVDHISKEIGQRVMERHFFESEEFDTPFPLPSLAKNEKAFDPNESIYIWRGPTWIVNNWFMHKYLIHTEHHEKAEKLLESMVQLVKKSGFREYYNPFTGEGYGAENFTWSGLVIDMIQSNQ